jgi:hypothetical protein
MLRCMQILVRLKMEEGFKNVCISLVEDGGGVQKCLYIAGEVGEPSEVDHVLACGSNGSLNHLM